MLRKFNTLPKKRNENDKNTFFKMKNNNSNNNKNVKTVYVNLK